MRGNLVILGIPEQVGEDPEIVINLKSFIKDQLKIPEETANRVTFHHVHHFGGKKLNGQRPDRSWLNLNITNRRTLSRATDVN